MAALKETAAALAGQYLTFLVAGEEYGIALSRVREIGECGTLTRVPGTPPWVRGVINLRGNVVAVVDLAVRLGLPPAEHTRLRCIVVLDLELGGETAMLGVLVDEVRQVLELGSGDVEPPPSFGTRVNVEYLLGIGRVGESFAVLLDIQRVLTADELVAAVAVAELPAEAATEGPDDRGDPAAGPSGDA